MAASGESPVGSPAETVRVGYGLREKRAASFLTPELLALAKGEGVEFVKVEPGTPGGPGPLPPHPPQAGRMPPASPLPLPIHTPAAPAAPGTHPPSRPGLHSSDFEGSPRPLHT